MEQNHLQETINEPLNKAKAISSCKILSIKNGNLIPKDKILLLGLPELVLEQILRYFSYRQIATFRTVSRRFNEICKSLLNRGYYLATKRYRKCLDEFEAMRTSGELSEFSFAFLDDYMDEFFQVESKICLLDLTFLLYMKSKRCCFFLGMLIDDICGMAKLMEGVRKHLWETNSGHVFSFTTYFADLHLDFVICTIEAVTWTKLKICPALVKSFTFPRVFIAPSVPLQFHYFVINSFCGRLTCEDIWSANTTMNFKYYDEIKIFREQIHAAQFLDGNPPQGIDRGLKAERIIGETKKIELSLFLLKWEETDEAEFVPMKQCALKFPEIVNQYMKAKVLEE